MKTNLRRGGLRGSQVPRVSSYPASAVDFSAGEDAIDLAAIAGRESLEWQELVVRQGMAQTEDGQWAAFEVGVEVSRQNGKNGSIEVVELGWMITEPGVSILHTAHEFQTALESMDKLEALIRSHPKLENEILSVRRGNGKESIRLKNGSVIRFRTRTKSGGRGFSVDRLVIDEAMIWSPASQAAIMPLLTTAERPQIWYLGSAADANTHEYCGKWASLRERAMAGGDAGLCWMEWSAPEPPDGAEARAAWREDRANWAAANPSLGFLLTEDYIENEMVSFRKSIEKWEVERLSAGVWPKDDDDVVREWQIVAESQWNGLVDYPALTGTIGIGVARVGAQWVIGGAKRTVDDRIHVEVAYTRIAPNPEIVDLIGRVDDALEPCAIATDTRSPAAVLEPLMKTAGIELIKSTTNQAALMCQGFVDDAEDGLISHAGQPALDYALAHASKRVLPRGDWVIDPANDPGIAALVAVVIARWALLTFESRSAGPAAAPAFDRVPESVSVNEAFDALTVAF